jgi:hypothetical protein
MLIGENKTYLTIKAKYYVTLEIATESAWSINL